MKKNKNITVTRKQGNTLTSNEGFININTLYKDEPIKIHNIRMEFMQRIPKNTPKKTILLYSNIYINIKLLGCKYSLSVENKLKSLLKKNKNK